MTAVEPSLSHAGIELYSESKNVTLNCRLQICEEE